MGNSTECFEMQVGSEMGPDTVRIDRLTAPVEEEAVVFIDNIEVLI